MKRFRKLFRGIGQAAGIVLVLAWFYSGSLESEFVYWPRQPRPDMGRIVPFVEKGITVYISTQDRALVTLLERIEIASGAIVLLAVFLSGEHLIKRRGTDH